MVPRNILLFVTFAVMLAPVPSPAVAQWLDPGRKWEERDAQGRRTGSIEPNQRGYVERDAQGRRTGSGEYGSSGRIIERDAQGRRTGSIEPGSGGNYVTRDAQGRNAACRNALPGKRHHLPERILAFASHAALAHVEDLRAFKAESRKNSAQKK